MQTPKKTKTKRSGSGTIAAPPPPHLRSGRYETDPIPVGNPEEAPVSHDGRNALLFLLATAVLLAGVMAWHIARPAIEATADAPNTTWEAQGP